MSARALLLLLPVAAVATGTAVAADEPLPRPVAANITDGTAQDRLDAARARWRTKGFRSYSEQVDLSCFCGPTPPRIVRVRGGRLGRPVASEIREVATVPRQFRLVQGAIDDRVSGLRVRYGRRGHPVSISIDPRADTADEESYYTMRRLTHLGRR